MPDHRRALVGAFLALALLPASAAAYPGERPANNQTIDRLTQHARDFWAARDLPTCTPTISLADSLADTDGISGVEGRADKTSCHIWILTRAVRDNQQMGGTRLCTIILHEVGHLAGLGHTPTGIMAPDGGSVVGPCEGWSAPRRCLVRHRVVRRHHRRVRVLASACRD